MGVVPTGLDADAADPSILRIGKSYFLYSTQDPNINVPVRRWDAATGWSAPVDAFPVLPAWATAGFTWAPSVLPLRDGRYELYYAAADLTAGAQCIGAAVSASPTGPFQSWDSLPLVCQPELGGSIDPSLLQTADGHTYLYWKSDGDAIGRPSMLFGQELAATGDGLVGRPVQLLTSTKRNWTAGVIENPTMVVVGGQYRLYYSGGWWNSDHYAMGYATCASPLGPCVDQSNSAPVLASTGSVAGPGGGSVFTDSGGNLWLAYHAWSVGKVGYPSGGRRSLHLVPLAALG